MRVDHQNSPYYPAFAGMSGSTSTCTTQTGNSIYRCYAYWNAGMVSTVTERTSQLSYSYDEARRRVHSHQLVNNVKTEETWYLWGPAGVFSHQQQNMDPTGQNVVSTEWHDYIQLGGRLVGEYASTTNSSGTTASTYYFHTDAQGSVTAITGGGAVVVEQDSYDAWGKQRQTNGAIDTGAGGNAHSGATCALAANDVQNRGWIGQESLGRRGVCLSDLNARLYDSLTASFVQPDQIVGQPFSTHGWNAYAYAGNNPMTFSDPTGMCFAGCFWKQPLFRDVIGIAVAATLDLWALPALEGASAGGLGVMNAGISGAASGAVSTGTFKGTVLAAAEAMAFSEIGTIKEGNAFLRNWAVSAAMHATAGGLFSVAEGGKFQSGFLAAGFADLAGTHFDIDGNGAGAIAVNTVTHGIIGGLGAVMGSGKFENGAITGAFGYLFNTVADKLAHSYLDRNSQISKFYNTNYDAVAAVAIQLGIDPTVLLGIAALESFWGTSKFATKYNDPFGATPHGDSSGALAYPSIGDAWGQWQSDWGSRIQGLGGNVSKILDSLEEDNRGPNGQGVPGAVDSRGAYNSENPNWKSTVTTVIGNVRTTLPMWQGNLDSKP
jgi:RHS repeat-associated protein